MSALGLIFQEIRYRKLNFALMLLGVTMAVGLYVAGATVVEGYHRDGTDEIARLEQEAEQELARLEDETRKIMLKLGFNLKILHRDTRMDDFWSEGYIEHDMPQEYVHRLANSDQLTLVTHLVATLQHRMTWEGRKVLLVGYLPETPRAHERANPKKPMGYNIEPGTVYVGHELAADRKEGDTLELEGREFRIAKVLPERGNVEDVMLAVHLNDAQELLDKPEKINQILAIGCKCQGALLPKVRAQLEEVLPETKIYEVGPQALARVEQRAVVAEEKKTMLAQVAAHRQQRQQRMESFAGMVIPAAVLVAAVWVGLLTLANVRERRNEIGLLRALGKSSARIAGLFLGKAVVLGAIGGAVGFGLGALLGWLVLTRGMDVSAAHYSLPSEMLLWSLLGAPVVCALASYLPALSAVTQDPAIVMREA
mgnify:CR=1 FL=1